MNLNAIGVLWYNVILSVTVSQSMEIDTAVMDP